MERSVTSLLPHTTYVLHISFSLCDNGSSLRVMPMRISSRSAGLCNRNSSFLSWFQVKTCISLYFRLFRGHNTHTHTHTQSVRHASHTSHIQPWNSNRENQQDEALRRRNSFAREKKRNQWRRHSSCGVSVKVNKKLHKKTSHTSTKRRCWRKSRWPDGIYATYAALCCGDGGSRCTDWSGTRIQNSVQTTANTIVSGAREPIDKKT